MTNFDYDIQNWWNLKWFHWEVLKTMEWEYPLWLWFIPVVVFSPVIRWVFQFKFRQKYPVAFFDKEVKGLNILRIVRHIPYLIFIIFLSLLLVCIARPTKSYEKNTEYSDGINIIYALDISESMLLEDIKPNRLEQAKKIIKQSSRNRKYDRLGLITFSGDAVTVVPLTNDSNLFFYQLDKVKFQPQLSGGTALGTAIGTGINRLKHVPSGEKVIVLISDGENTTGVLDPETSADLCKSYGIKLYTISLGSDGIFSYHSPTDGLQYIETHVDIELLKKLADKTGGQYISSNSASELNNILNQLEKGRVLNYYYSNKKDFYLVYLKWGIVFFIIWMFLRLTWINNYLED